MRSLEFAPREYYHLLNRGVGKKNIFQDENDYIRFLFLILHCQSPTSFDNIGYSTKVFKNTNRFRVSEKAVNDIVENRYVRLIAFCLMPNHFHLLVFAETENGISQYMQRIQDAYTKYFNTKNKTSGHLLQGPFRATHIKNNDQLLYLSSYIHKNCSELLKWRGQEVNYKWSSFGDYVKGNRWPKLLDPEIILDQFSDPKDYAKWSKNSIAKERNLD